MNNNMNQLNFKGKKCLECGKPLRARTSNAYKDFKQRKLHVKCWKQQEDKKEAFFHLQRMAYEMNLEKKLFSK